MIEQLQVMTAADRDPEEFARIEDAIAAMRGGEMVIVVDDAGRENHAMFMAACTKRAKPKKLKVQSRGGHGFVGG